MKKVRIFLIISLFTFLQMYSQQEFNRANYWINLGAIEQNNDLSLHYSFNFRTGGISFSAMFNGTGDLLGGANSDGYKTRTVAILAGYSISDRYYLAALMAGPGIIWGTNYNVKYLDDFTNNCFVTNLQTYFLPIKEIGVGFEIILNFNKQKTFKHFHLSMNYLFY